MKNRGQKIIAYLEDEINCINNWILAHPKCNRNKLIKQIYILKLAKKVLELRIINE